jgi:hypothetical protein
MADRERTACWVVAGAALVAVALLLGYTPTGEWDAWWHLAIGRAAVGQGTSLPTDPFSYSFAGAPWGHKDLLADALLYLGFEAIGHAAFAALKALAVIALAVSLLAVMPRAGRHPALAVLLGGAAISAIQYRLVERPVVFSLALLPIALALLERMRRMLSRPRPAPFAAALPIALLLWAWAWLHREVLIGAALAAIYAASLWLARLAGAGRGARLLGPRPEGRPLAIATAIVFGGCALCAATPSGLDLIASSASAARSDMLRRIITDWTEIGPRELVADFPMTAVLVAAASIACVVRLGRALREGPGEGPLTAVHGAVLAALLALALLDSVRWVPALSTFAAVVLAIAAGDAAAATARPRSSRRRLTETAAAGLAVLALVGGRNNLGHGLGPMPDRFPEGAMRFAREHDLGPKAFDSFHLGGYAIWAGWPKFRVLVDGRNDVIYPPEFVEAAARSQSDPALFAALLARYGGDWILASNLPGHAGFPFLRRDPAWMMPYWSEAAVVYVRRADRPDLAGLEYRFVDPLAVDVSVVEAVRRLGGDPAAMSELEREVLRMRAASPDGLRANAAAALYYHFRGPSFSARRDTALAVLRAKHADDPAVRELFGRMGAR